MRPRPLASAVSHASEPQRAAHRRRRVPQRAAVGAALDQQPAFGGAVPEEAVVGRRAAGVTHRLTVSENFVILVLP